MCLLFRSATSIWLQVCWGGGQHPPLYEGACGPWWYLAGSTSPPPEGSLPHLPDECLHHWLESSSDLRVGQGGMWSALSELPPAGGLPLTVSIGHPQGPQGPSGKDVKASLQDEGCQGQVGNHLPTWGQGLGARGACTPLSHISSEMGGSGRAGMESDRFIVPCHGCTQETCGGHHFGGRMEFKKCFSLQNLEHTIWVCLAQIHA